MKTIQRALGQHGFSLLEMMATISISAIVGSMATASLVSARRAYQGDGAMRLVMAQLNTAREMAITQRHNMEVQFVGGNWVRIVRDEITPGVTTVLMNVALEGGAQFALTPGVPDTPDGFGASSPVAFGTATTVMFTTDGTLIDSSGTPINGTVFLSILNQQQSARAVTVLGSTGRVRGYKWVVGKTSSGWLRV